MLVRATWPFFMVEGGRIYEVGETYDATDAEAERLVRRGLAEPVGAQPAGDAPSLGGMTAAQLRALCAKRGVEAPRKATKAQLMELLEG